MALEKPVNGPISSGVFAWTMSLAPCMTLPPRPPRARPPGPAGLRGYLPAPGPEPNLSRMVWMMLVEEWPSR